VALLWIFDETASVQNFSYVRKDPLSDAVVIQDNEILTPLIKKEQPFDLISPKSYNDLPKLDGKELPHSGFDE